MAYSPGFRPGVLGPLIRPIFRPNISSAYSSIRLSARFWRVSRPWIVLAAAQRALPSLVFGPVDNPPCVLHTSFPFKAGALHCCFVRFDWALHCLQRIRPPIVRKVVMGTSIITIKGAQGALLIYVHCTSWLGEDFCRFCRYPQHLFLGVVCKNTHFRRFCRYPPPHF